MDWREKEKQTCFFYGQGGLNLIITGELNRSEKGQLWEKKKTRGECCFRTVLRLPNCVLERSYVETVKDSDTLHLDLHEVDVL